MVRGIDYALQKAAVINIMDREQQAASPPHSNTQTPQRFRFTANDLERFWMKQSP